MFFAEHSDSSDSLAASNLVEVPPSRLLDHRVVLLYPFQRMRSWPALDPRQPYPAALVRPLVRLLVRKDVDDTVYPEAPPVACFKT